MPHGLDHIVHAIRDLDAAAESYARAGFTVGARNRHPWGTHNRIVQFFLKAFAGVDDLHSSSIGVRACTENCDIEIMEPVAFFDQFGLSPDVDGEGMTLNGLRLEVADIVQTEALLRQNGIGSRRHVGRLVVPPHAAHGATLIFETAKEG